MVGIIFTAVNPGVEGNAISVTVVNSFGGADFTVSVSGNAITLTLGYTVVDGEDSYNITYPEIASDWNASVAAALATAFSDDPEDPTLTLPEGTFFLVNGAAGGANGVYYWEQTATPLNPARAQYIKRVNAPGH